MQIACTNFVTKIGAFWKKSKKNGKTLLFAIGRTRKKEAFNSDKLELNANIL